MPLRWSILMIPKFTFQSIQFLYFIPLISEVYKDRGLFKITGRQSRSGWRTRESWDVDHWHFLCSQKVWLRPSLMEARCCVFLKRFNTHFFFVCVCDMLNESGLAKFEARKPLSRVPEHGSLAQMSLLSVSWVLLSPLQILLWSQPCTEIANDAEPVFRVSTCAS